MECDKAACNEVVGAVRELVEIKQRLQDGDAKFKDFADMKKQFDVFLQEWAETKGQVAKTTEIVSAWENLKGFNVTLNFISGFMRVVLFIGAIFASFYIAFKGAK